MKYKIESFISISVFRCPYFNYEFINSLRMLSEYLLHMGPVLTAGSGQ